MGPAQTVYQEAHCAHLLGNTISRAFRFFHILNTSAAHTDPSNTDYYFLTCSPFVSTNERPVTSAQLWVELPTSAPQHSRHNSCDVTVEAQPLYCTLYTVTTHLARDVPPRRPPAVSVRLLKSSRLCSDPAY